MANSKQIEKEITRYSQKIFLLNEIIHDTTISDNGVYVYIYLRAIQREDMNLYYISATAIEYFYTHLIGMDTRSKKKYVDGLNDLESHGLIKKTAEKGYEFEYDLSNIYFNPRHTNKENKQYFTVIESNELWKIIQINDDDHCIKQKLIRYFVTLISTFLKGERYKIKLPDGTKQDGIVGYQSIEHLAEISGLSTDTVILYNSLFEKNNLIYIYRANAIKLIDCNSISGISNTYGRYEHKDIIIQYGINHKVEYGYDKGTDNLKYKSQKTTERKRLGVKLYYLMTGKKEYDEETIIQLYKYAVEYNRLHKDSWDYNNRKKDLEFFCEYDFLKPYISDEDLLEIETLQTAESNEIEDNGIAWGKNDAMEY